MDSDIALEVENAQERVKEAEALLEEAEKTLALEAERAEVIKRLASEGSRWVEVQHAIAPCLARKRPRERPWDDEVMVLLGDISVMMAYDDMEDHYGNQVGHLEVWL